MTTNNGWYTLTDAEREELSAEITGGNVIPDHYSERDSFEITLSSGALVTGSYLWSDADATEWELEVAR